MNLFFHHGLKNGLSDDWVCEYGKNKYFVGTRYDKAWTLGLSNLGNDAVVYEGEYYCIACDIHLDFRTNLAPLADTKVILVWNLIWFKSEAL